MEHKKLEWGFDRYVDCAWEGVDGIVTAYRYKANLNGRTCHLFVCDESDTAMVHVINGAFLCPEDKAEFPKPETMDALFDTASETAWELFNRHFKGVEFWATGRWNTNNRITEGYAGYIKKIMQDVDVRFVKVAAHTGIPGNEEADALAKKAVGIL